MNTDINYLTLPVFEDKPFGEYLKRHPKIIKLKDLRNANIESSTIDEGIWAKKENSGPNWQNSIDLCEEILRENSKDLLVCSYYIEAQFRVNGFEGLSLALKVMLYFCVNSWEEIFPPLEEDNLELRLSPFHWLEVNMPLVIKCFSLNRQNPEEVKLTWDDYERAVITGHEEHIRIKNELKKALANESKDYIMQLHESLSSILHSLNQLEEYVVDLAESCGEKTSLDSLIKLCQEIFEFIETFVEENRELEKGVEDNNFQSSDNFISRENEEYADEENNPEDFDSKQNEFSLNQTINSIEMAYSMIEKANLYLLKNNSHSPSPYLIRRALEWQKKSLYEVFIELFTTTSKPSEIFTLLGLSKADAKNKKV
ncbi:ImpA family type VI secretion system protein [Fluviispira multicolorata]|uniref:ImpA N-terminal domain-containing protein n=1 Tax=Fluviispira multicolorata TaxID=2654512 RepID=A0A833JDI4_9BACT|nr:type VI secretion system ImpA family N-terminal domain-containing protein [Fluviispira multicolorata]KAB8031910.1 hypothetical protein GCL57_04500 [Fluviispira multicolorata]